ncbi:MAG TPA: PIN domain-containing protein [Thermomicrobiales bacterium]|nr:PIN domain-containing protein [Thermomicrobiales bacterium]
MIRRFPQYPRLVFVDTSALFAMVDRDDDFHSSVVAATEEIVAAGGQLVVTNFVFAELHALLLSRINRHVARTALTRLRDSHDVSLVRVSVDDEQRAWEIIDRFTDKDFSFADASSFAVMECLGITHALSLDAHFVQYGWVMLPVDRE